MSGADEFFPERAIPLPLHNNRLGPFSAPGLPGFGELPLHKKNSIKKKKV
jgi:hypothetical protein